MPKIIIELKVLEIKEIEKGDYAKTIEHMPEENKLKIEVDSFDLAEKKVAAFFKMLGLS